MIHARLVPEGGYFLTGILASIAETVLTAGLCSVPLRWPIHGALHILDASPGTGLRFYMGLNGISFALPT